MTAIKENYACSERVILLVEDDLNLAQFIRKGLKEEQYAVDFSADGEEGLGRAEACAGALGYQRRRWDQRSDGFSRILM